MIESKGCFSATMSYHTMLRRAQELSPALTYALCKLLLDAELKGKRANVCSQRIMLQEEYDKSGFGGYFIVNMTGRNEMGQFLEMIFSNITVRLSPFGTLCGDECQSVELRAHRQFVVWLKKLHDDKSLMIDNEQQHVTIPA